jgi:23S rRNA (uracil1939-C5)-methyltransferase
MGDAGRSPSPGRQRVEIRDLSYGPHGIGRLADGKAVFVRSVAPAEEVEVVVREDHKTFAYADLQRVLRPSPDRRAPPCEYLPRCGGCPWQHLTYAAQLRAKEQNVRDAVSRIGKIDPAVVRPIIASPAEFAYRRRISLRVEAGDVGYYAAASHTLVPVAHCLLAEPEVDAAIGRVRELVRRLSSNIRRIEIVARGSHPGVALQAEVEGALASDDVQRIDSFLGDAPEVAGIALRGRGWHLTRGEVGIDVTGTDGVELRMSAGTFMQVNPAGNRLLIDSVLDLGGFVSSDRVLELHAGAGNLTLPIASRVQHVVAVEQHEPAALAARDNAATLAHVEVRMSSAVDAVRAAVAQGRSFDVVVLDPPRGGATEVVAGLLRLSPRRIVYVSCNPTTLARDLARMLRAYRVEVVQPIDMFPHTYHVESVATAVLT